MATAMKRARARVARGLAMATRVAGDKWGWGWCEGHGHSRYDCMMVATGHGLCEFLCVWRDQEK
jgi:hypothetical protein